MQQGEVTVAYETFDVHAKGGTLRYFDGTGLAAQWKLPVEEAGELPELDKAIAES